MRFHTYSFNINFIYKNDTRNFCVQWSVFDFGNNCIVLILITVEKERKYSKLLILFIIQKTKVKHTFFGGNYTF